MNKKLTREETEFPLDDMSLSPNSRHARWDQLMAENKGRIDRRRGKAVPRRSLRHVRKEGSTERADAVRSRGPFAARRAGLAASLRDRGRRPEQSHGRAMAEQMSFRGGGACVRTRLQGGGAPGESIPNTRGRRKSCAIWTRTPGQRLPPLSNRMSLGGSKRRGHLWVRAQGHLSSFEQDLNSGKFNKPQLRGAIDDLKGLEKKNLLTTPKIATPSPAT